MNENIIEKFISKYGIKAAVIATSIGTDKNKCRISLKGGYSIVIEVINNKLFKDGDFYCYLDFLNT